jgi:hypothetical protein
MASVHLFDQCPNVTDPVLQDAFDIALGYLEATRQALPLDSTKAECGRVIIEEWAKGKRYRVWLANKAIRAIEDGRPG